MRFWLIDLPARLADIGWRWYRLYLIIALLLAGPGLLLMGTMVLVLWFGFGIRWGW